jgi:hypothetical protein
MQVQKINQNAYLLNKWAHGETTEIYIYPEDGNYTERDFLWRVSSATVDSDSSDFTVLFGVKRWIMPYDATLLLTHTNNSKPLYSITLKPYEAHCFKGDWTTSSVGKTRDFNLMLKEGAYGILKPTKLLPEAHYDLGHLFQEAFDERLPLADHNLTLGMYSRDSDIEIKLEDETLFSTREDLLLIHYTLEEVDKVKTFILSQNTQSTSHVVMFAVTY